MRSLIVSALAIAVAGCGHERGSGIPRLPGVPATITLTAASADPLVSAGETRDVIAVARDAEGTMVPTPALSWTSSAPAVATVSGSGTGATITAVDDGTADITAATGSVAGRLTVTVRRRVVSIELSAPDSIVPAGSSMQLAVVGRDARQQEMRRLSGVTFATGNALSVIVSPEGVVTALFNPFQPGPTAISASLTREGVTLNATTRITVGSAAPPAFDIGAFMLTEAVEPEPVRGIGQGIIFLTLDGPRVQFKTLWSLISGPPTSAHIHGPAPGGGVAPVLVDLSLGAPQLWHGVATGAFSAADIRGPADRPPLSLDSLVSLMRTSGAAYVDIHTSLFPGGELRGPLTGFR